MRLELLLVVGACLPLLASCVSSKPVTLPDGSKGRGDPLRRPLPRHVRLLRGGRKDMPGRL